MIRSNPCSLTTGASWKRRSTGLPAPRDVVWADSLFRAALPPCSCYATPKEAPLEFTSSPVEGMTREDIAL